MKQGIFEIIENRPLNGEVMRLRLRGDTGAITCPGQFVNIKVEDCFLRRPLSVCDWDADSLTLVYRVVGRGTEQLSKMQSGHLDLLTGLGNGFDVSKCGQRTLVIGGGAGVPPMYGLAKALQRAGKTPAAILGFNKKEEIFYEEQFRALGVETAVTTVDGSYGTRGFVTDAM